jgi:hypothetical protein
MAATKLSGGGPTEKDIVREQYKVLLWSIPLGRGRAETRRGEMQGGALPHKR